MLKFLELTGQGVLEFPEGSEFKRYEGSFRKGRFHGRGVLTFSGGLILGCPWKEGNPVENDAMLISPGGEMKYLGEIMGLVPKGKGTLHYQGFALSGTWDGFNPVGRTARIVTDCSEYEGEVKEMKMHGKGVLRRFDGSSYRGDFVEGRFHGRGVFTDTDGSSYHGDFAHGMFDGYGTQTDRSGRVIYAGLWEENKISSVRRNRGASFNENVIHL